MKSPCANNPNLISAGDFAATKNGTQARNAEPVLGSFLGLLFRSGSKKHEACEEIANADTPAKFGGALNSLIQDYYQDVLNQARMSFNCAAIASVAATMLFLLAIYCTMKAPSKPQTLPTNQTETVVSETVASETAAPSTSTLTLIAGALVEVIAGINFYLYARTSRQLAAYHICLERTNRFLLVNSICDELSKDNKHSPEKTKLIETMLNAPMLTVAQATGAIVTPNKNDQGQSESNK